MPRRYILPLILLLGLLIRLWVCSQDQFLHEWDERYHALVAKNLIEHPLRPTLYDTPLLPYNPDEWAFNHIWLSKPPLPLWSMALSLHFLGLHEWALRFPSLLFSLISIVLTYLIGRRLFDEKTALWAAFFHAIHGLLIELAGGRISSDHVETMFLMLLEWGFYGVVCYYRSVKNHVALALGVGAATGLAFMCKWTAAFILPMVWITLNLFSSRKLPKRLVETALAGCACLVVAMPWVLFIYHEYPVESALIFKGMFSPIATVTQDHQGGAFFYLWKIGGLFGELIYLPLAWLLYKAAGKFSGRTQQIPSRLLLACWIMVPLLLLSSAATKRITYILVAAPAFFLVTALFIRLLTRNRKEIPGKEKLCYGFIFLLVGLPIRYSIERSKVFSTRDTNPEWAIQLKKLAKTIGPKTVVFNEPHPIEAMFYTGCVAYLGDPGPGKTQELKNQGWQVMENKGGVYLLR